MQSPFTDKQAAPPALSYKNATGSALISMLILFLERMAHYGARAMLILFLLDEVGMIHEHAFTVYGLFGAAILLTPMLCGWICDVFLDKRLAMLAGNVLGGLGMFLIASGSYEMLMVGLGLWAVGSGALRPAQLVYFGEMASTWGKWRLGSAYTLLYAVINIGALMGPLAFAVFGQEKSFSVGFILIGAVFFVNAVITGLSLGLGLMEKEHGTDPETDEPTPAAPGIQGIGLTVLFGILLVIVPFMLTGLNMDLGRLVLDLKSPLILLLFFSVVAVGLVLSLKKIIGTITAIAVMIFSAIFWLSFEAAGSSWGMLGNIMAEEYNMSSASFQSINPLLIVFLCVLIGGVGMAITVRKPALVGGVKLMTGFFLGMAGYGLAMLAMTAQYMAIFVVMGMLLLALAEVLVVPVVLSLVFRSAPRRSRTTLMGAFIGGSSGLAMWGSALFFRNEFQYEMEVREGIAHGFFNAAIVLGIGGLLCIGLLALLSLQDRSRPS